MNIVIFGVYLLVLLILFAFISIVVMHIGGFKEYSKYLSVVLKIYLIVVLLISFFGGYKILTDYTPAKKNRVNVENINF